MLKNLYIENIAVIEKTAIDFTGGLNVLTGETGAGKSIVIDSINAILGNRTSRDLIRNGSENAFVSAEFDELSDRVLEKLNGLGFSPEEDGSVMIQRELTLSGKGKCRINGRPTTVGVLKELGEYLIDIHGQHASYELMQPELHINYIDKLGNMDDALDEYRKAYREYSKLKSELEKAELDEGERARRLDLLRYQVQELEQIRVLAEILANRSGEQIVYDSLARDASIDPKTAKKWIGTLKYLYYGFEVRPWFRNVENSIRKTPKWYLRDWSRIGDAGNRFETMAACHLLKAVEAWTDLGYGNFELHYLRDKQKREVDFLVSRDGRAWFIAEVKASDTHLSAGLGHYQLATGARHAFQIVFDEPFVKADCFARTDPVVVPARTFLSQLV